MDEPGPHLPGDSPPCGDAGPEPGASSAPGDAGTDLPSSGDARPPAPSAPGTGQKAQGAKQAASRKVERPLTIGQVQRVLEMRLGFTVSINALERWCRQGKIYAVRLGPEWRIPRETVEELIKTALHGERL
jgi:excisionase family DNA binding protein